MSPNVLCLERCRELALAYPNAKTEYVWCQNTIKNEPMILGIETAISLGFKVVCPAWQIHKLLEILPAMYHNEDLSVQLFLYMRKIEKGYSAGYEHCNGRPHESFGDVSLVEALGKLAIWVKKNDLSNL